MTTLFAILLATSPWSTPTEEKCITGPPTRYDKDLMETVAVNRGFIPSTLDYQDWLATNGYDGAVALQRCGDKYREVWIGGKKYFALDCRQEKDYPRKWEFEVDYPTAMKWLATGPWPESVTACFVEPVWAVMAE